MSDRWFTVCFFLALVAASLGMAALAWLGRAPDGVIVFGAGAVFIAIIGSVVAAEDFAKADQSPKGEDPKRLSSRERRSRRDLPE